MYQTMLVMLVAEELHKATLITQAMKFSKVMDTEDWVRSLELL